MHFARRAYVWLFKRGTEPIALSKLLRGELVAQRAELNRRTRQATNRLRDPRVPHHPIQDAIFPRDRQ